jgi:hypothetical protein
VSPIVKDLPSVKDRGIEVNSTYAGEVENNFRESF